MVPGLADEEVRAIAREIMSDYEANEGPFATCELPEYAVLDDFETREDRATFITFTTAINMNRETTGEGGVWQKCKRLFDHPEYTWVFEPDYLAGMNGIDLYNKVFSQLGLGDTAPGIWCAVGAALHEDVDGNVLRLLKEMEYNAAALKHHFEEYEYQSLRRAKVGPLWLRLIHEEIHALEDIDQISLPVDRHIITVTEALTGVSYSRDSNADLKTIRAFWDDICVSESFVPVIIDKPLWLVGKYWDKWGADYIEKKRQAVE